MDSTTCNNINSNCSNNSSSSSNNNSSKIRAQEDSSSRDLALSVIDDDNVIDLDFQAAAEEATLKNLLLASNQPASSIQFTHNSNQQCNNIVAAYLGAYYAYTLNTDTH